ncbi:MAG TPA: NAD(+) synthase [Sedimentibacter sp.]|nr:NAD(+) synthase [Sedimentibacter sp.]HOW22025.1 NAD(+) synthase [Sedimentibacter sp.]HRC79960.1 NAD(+) synthase [Sedimentibacter sp.]
MDKSFEYIRVASAVPSLRVAEPNYNVKEMIKIAFKAAEQGVKILVFPELSMTGYTCQDLFHQKTLTDECQEALRVLLEETKYLNMLIALGMPVRADSQLFNCAAVIKEGKILGLIPKTYLPNYKEFYEKRWFAPACKRISETINLCDQEVPFNEKLLFKDDISPLCLGIEICEDLWAPIPPSSYHSLNGANLILNLSASNDLAGKTEYRRDLVRLQSSKCISAYVYSCAGEEESTTDLVFSGHCMVAENGILLEEDKIWDGFLYSDIDLEKLDNERVSLNTFMNKTEKKDYKYVSFNLGCSENLRLKRFIDPRPFVPSNPEARDRRAADLINMQATGLAQRMKKINSKKAILGISGGLDSTLALLVTIEAFKKLKMPLTKIIAVIMPGFGTSQRTYKNAHALIGELGVSVREISIKEACLQHYKDISHDIYNHNVVYENAQARERTQILMDIANQEGGLVVGTGDLSELALGWCTYNGDHMSMYGVNSGVPKTLVRYMVKWYADYKTSGQMQKILLDICQTPVSPELLPPDKEGNISQFTEQSVGSYELNDFFLYNMIRNGYGPEKIYYLAKIAFKDEYDQDLIYETLKKFYKRFFTQQFKRSCMPDGVKVGSVSLSPRGDWKMPSDASFELWIKKCENIKK